MAISYVEVLMSMFLIGGGLFSGMQLAGSYVQHKQANIRQRRAEQLARALMAEILSRPPTGYPTEPSGYVTAVPDLELPPICIFDPEMDPIEALNPQSSPPLSNTTREEAFDSMFDFTAWSGTPICNLDGGMANYIPFRPDAPVDPEFDCQPDYQLSPDLKGYRRTLLTSDLAQPMATITVEVRYYADFPQASAPPEDAGELLARVTEFVRTR